MTKVNTKIINKVEKDKLLSDKTWIYNLLKTHKKAGEGFGECISNFWDDKSIMELATIIAKRIKDKK